MLEPFKMQIMYVSFGEASGSVCRRFARKTLLPQDNRSHPQPDCLYYLFAWYQFSWSQRVGEGGCESEIMF